MEDKKKIYMKKYREKNKIKLAKQKKDYYIKNKGQKAKESKTYYNNHKEEISLKGKERRKKNPDEYKNYYLKNKDKLRINRTIADRKKRYGITEEDFNLMVKKCKCSCEICGTPLNLKRHSKPMKNDVCVDHNHDTGKVRGLLCNYCNLGLGLYNDDINKLKNSIKYLKKYDINKQTSKR